jgi:hypothetical protein
MRADERAGTTHEGDTRMADRDLRLREARETHYWLPLVAASDLAKPDDLQEVLSEADALVAIFTTAVRKAKQPPVVNSSGESGT